MGFPSPATDYVENRVSLDDISNIHMAGVYLFKADLESPQAGIKRGALLVCNSTLEPLDGSLIAMTVDNHFKVVRFRNVPRLHLEDINNPDRKIKISEDEMGLGEEGICFGVVTHVLNDVRVKLEAV